MPSHDRKGAGSEVKRIPEPHRKNLELLFSYHLQFALMLANVGLIIAVMALLAFFQIPGIWGPVVYLAVLIIVILLIVPRIRNSIGKLRKISKKLGCEVSFKKYVEHDSE